MKNLHCYFKSGILLFSILFISLPTYSQSTFIPESGMTYNIQAGAVNNRYIEVAGSSAEPGANILLRSLSRAGGTPNQQFHFVGAGDGFYYIESRLKDRMVIDINNWGTTDGTNAQLVRRGNGTSAQKFRIVNAGNGYVKIVSAMGNSLYLGVWDDNQNVVLRNGDKGGKVLFKLVPASSEQRKQAFSPRQGVMYTIQSPAAGQQYLDVAGAKTVNGTNVTLYWSNTTEGFHNQRFRFVPASNGFYYIESILKPGMVLDIDMASSNAQLWSKLGGVNQLFQPLLSDNGSVQFVSAANPAFYLGISDQHNNVVLRNGDRAEKITFRLYEIDPVQMDATPIPYLGREDRGNGVVTYKYQQVSKEIRLDKVESGKNQQPQAFLSLSTNVGTYQNQRYINISTGGSRVAATKDGRLSYDQQDMRGYFLEYVDIEIKCLTPGFSLPAYGPSTTQSEGSVSSTSGINFSSGASISKESSVNFSEGLNFGMTYSSNLKAFTVQDNSSGNTVKTRYKLSSTNSSETWSNPKGGNAPYTKYQDLLRMDAAGQFGGTPLNYLPDLAISNLKLASIGTFKAPNNFRGKAVFEVKIKMRLRFVEKTNYFFKVDVGTRLKDYEIVEKFVVDCNQ